MISSLKAGSFALAKNILLAIDPSEHHALGDQHRRERLTDQREEAQPAAAVGMHWHEAEFDARHLPEETRPHEHPKIPAQEQELEDRQAHAAQPPAGERRLEFSAPAYAMPGRHVGREMGAPDDADAHDIDERDDEHLRGDGIAQAHGRRDGRVELRSRRIRDQAARQKLSHQRAHSLVDDQFRQNQ